MKKLADNVWVVEKDFKFVGADFGNRMTIIKLPSGKLLLHSPVKFSETVASEIDGLGTVSFIITPNNFHGLFVDDWCNRFNDAKHYTVKPITNHRSLVLDENITQELESVIRVIKIQGAPRVNEFAFIHMPSETLILTDIAFNIGENISLWSRIFFTMNGAYKQFGPSRLMKSMIEDPAALNRSIQRIVENKFSRIIVSHGNIVESNAMVIFENAFRQFQTQPEL